MNTQTLFTFAVSATVSAGISILALILATVTFIDYFFSSRRRKARLSEATELSKFNHIQILHHEKRIKVLENKENVDSNKLTSPKSQSGSGQY